MILKLQTALLSLSMFLASADQAAAKMAIATSLRGADALLDRAKGVQGAIAVSDKTNDEKTKENLDMLLSEQCASLNHDINHYYEELIADFTDEEIMEYSCNGLQRKKSMDRMKAKEMDMVTQTDPCIYAADEIIAMADSDGIVAEELGDEATCRENVSFLLDALRGQLDSPEFVEVDGFLTALAIATGVASIGASAATIAGTVAAASSSAGTVVVVLVVVPFVPPPP